MIFYFILFWCTTCNLSLPFVKAGGEEFQLNGFESESRRWKNPHSDVFGSTDNQVREELSELLGTARGAVENENLHAAVQACQGQLLALSQQIKNNDVHIKRFVKHLIKVYDESTAMHEGTILMKINPEDMEALRSFADKGILFTSTYNNIHDLLRVTLTLPPKSIVDKTSPLMYIISKLAEMTKMAWHCLRWCFQEIRFLLTEELLSADAVILAAMFLPLAVLLWALWKGYSMITSLMLAGLVVAMIGYYAELRNAIDTNRAKNLARMARSREIPPECRLEEMGYFDSFLFSIRSVFTQEDRCEKYYQDQFAETPIQPTEVFWNTMFTPMTVAMEKFGTGLRQFMASFGRDSGWITQLILMPIGIMAVLIFLAMTLAAMIGGSFSVPVFGTVSFKGSNQRAYTSPASGAVSSDSPSVQPASITPAGSVQINLIIGPTQEQAISLVKNAGESNISVNHSAIATHKADDQTSRIGPTTQQSILPPNGNPETENQISEHREVQCLMPETGTSTSQHRPPLLTALSETEAIRQSVGNGESVNRRFALNEIGSGDSIFQGEQHRVMPSNFLRHRNHFRKHSI